MGQAIAETAAESRGLVVDMGWGDYRLVDAPNTRVSAEQVAAFCAEEVVEAGASEVRFGDQMGEILAVCADGRWVEIGVDGSVQDVTTEVMG